MHPAVKTYPLATNDSRFEGRVYESREIPVVTGEYLLVHIHVHSLEQINVKDLVLESWRSLVSAVAF